MRIAICDDDSNITRGLKKDICAFFKDLKIHVDFSIFADGSELIKEIKNKDFNFDIIFMDIDMPETSGFDAARIIREIDEDTIIIFVSSYEEYVFESLEYNPFRYIRKSRINEELTPALKSCCVLYKNRQKKYVVIKSDDGGHRIKQSDIWYFEIVKRKLLIHLVDDQVLSIWKSVKEFRKQIADEDFVKINSGCVVNMKYIKDYTNQDVTLDNGKKLFTSRAGLKAVKEKLATYMGERII